MENGKLNTKKLSTLNSQLSITEGFTLIEILVTMAVMAIVGTILVVVYTNTLRGSNKSQILAVIKQNGQAVLENMDKTIRSADNVCVTNTAKTLVVIKSGYYTRYRFIDPTTTANGLIEQDNPIQPTPPAPNNDIKLFINSLCTDDTDPLSSSAVALTDTNTQSGVSVRIGSFSRNTQAGFKDSVTVTFTLGPGVSAPAVVAGQIDAVAFQTTVQLR